MLRLERGARGRTSFFFVCLLFLILADPGWTAPPQDVLIVLDPGHGGEDPGVTGPGGLTEKEICLDLAKRIKERIDQRLGYPTFLTRSRDEAVSLGERAAQANNHLGTVFVSIHLAGFPDQSLQGFGIYSFRPVRTGPPASDKVSDALSPWDTQQVPYLNDSGRLAESLRREFLRGLPSEKEIGARALPVYPLGAVGMPAVLVEPAVLTSPAQEDRLRKESYREQIAEVIFEGIRHFVKPGGPGGGKDE